LQDEREEITAAEDQGVCTRTEARKVFPEDDYNARKTEIDGGREESRCNGDADEVDEKVVARGIEGVLMQHDQSRVSYNLTGEAKEHSGHVTPGLVTYADEYIGEKVDTEDGGVESISTKAGNVIEVSKTQVAKRHVAQRIMIAKDGEITVSSVIVPVETCDAICGNKESKASILENCNSAVGIGRNIGAFRYCRI
jgi:hypothetical protein